MELAILNDKFLPSRLVEGHQSLIWTERWSSAGDFQRTSEDIGGTIQALPLEDPDASPPVPPTIVTLRDSNVPMIVETHKIEKSATGAPVITTYGRSFETVLDRRTTVANPIPGTAPITAYTNTALTAVDFAYLVANRVAILGSASSADVIPEITLSIKRPSGYTAPSVSKTFTADLGELYSWLLSQIQTENYGIRAVRPADASTSKISVEIYTGTDRTKQVVFDARFDQFDNSVYLLSRAAWKNTDQVNAAHNSLEVNDGTSRTGLARRVSYFDGSQTATGASGDSATTNVMQNLGKVDLAKQLETALFSGEVSRQMGSLYGRDYFLGDIVKLTGDYGLSQFVRVSEFIRSEDNTGEKAYPTFASL